MITTRSIADSGFRIVLVCLLGWLVYVAVRALPISPVNARELYRDLPSDVLGITEPVEIVDSAVWEDGGTMFLVLKDAERREFRACIDGRSWGEKEGDLFLGADHPMGAGGYSVGIGGPEEAALFAVLARYFDEHPIDPNEERPWTRQQWSQRFAEGFMRSLESRLIQTYRSKEKRGLE